LESQKTTKSNFLELTINGGIFAAICQKVELHIFLVKSHASIPLESQKTTKSKF